MNAGRTMSWIAAVGHLAAGVAAATTAVPRDNAVVLGLACSVLAIVAATERTPTTRRALTAVIAGHAIAAALLLLSIAPSIPSAIPLVALAGAAALGVAIRPLASRPPRPLAVTPRVAAIALLGQAGLQLWLDSAPVLTTPLRAAALLVLAALGTAILASFAILALRLGRAWLVAGVLAWAVGWIASAADLGPLLLGVLGAPYPLGLHQLHVDAALVQGIATLGGLAIGAALILAIREARFRHSAMILLASFAVFGVLAAIREHRIELATNLASIVPIRNDRDLAIVIAHGALAGVLWMYWRRVWATGPGEPTVDESTAKAVSPYQRTTS